MTCGQASWLGSPTRSAAFTPASAPGWSAHQAPHPKGRHVAHIPHERLKDSAVCLQDVLVGQGHPHAVLPHLGQDPREGLGGKGMELVRIDHEQSSLASRVCWRLKAAFLIAGTIGPPGTLAMSAPIEPFASFTFMMLPSSIMQ
jgi:hypothetical protein